MENYTENPDANYNRRTIFFAEHQQRKKRIFRVTKFYVSHEINFCRYCVNNRISLPFRTSDESSIIAQNRFSELGRCSARVDTAQFYSIFTITRPVFFRLNNCFYCLLTCKNYSPDCIPIVICCKNFIMLLKTSLVHSASSSGAFAKLKQFCFFLSKIYIGHDSVQRSFYTFCERNPPLWLSLRESESKRKRERTLTSRFRLSALERVASQTTRFFDAKLKSELKNRDPTSKICLQRRDREDSQTTETPALWQSPAAIMHPVSRSRRRLCCRLAQPAFAYFEFNFRPNFSFTIENNRQRGTIVTENASLRFERTERRPNETNYENQIDRPCGIVTRLRHLD